MLNIKKEITDNRLLIWLFFLFLLINILILFFLLEDSKFSTHDSIGYLKLSDGIFNNYLNRPPGVFELTLTRTPVYPLFLYILNNSLLKIILVQILLHLIMSIMSVALVRILLDRKRKNLENLIFIFIQLESSLFTYSFRILSEILFAFFILLLFLLFSFKQKTTSKFSLNILIYLVLIIIILIRPIALAFVFVFLCMCFVSKDKKFYFNLFLVTCLTIVGYSTFNYNTAKIYTYSLIQNHNLLFWEAAPSEAISKQIPLEDIQEREKIKRSWQLGNERNIYLENQYNKTRAIELISENKISFIKLHLSGAARVLFGPNRFELLHIFSGEGKLFLSTQAKYFIVSVSLLLTFLISFLGLIGSLKFFSKGEVFQTMSLVLYTMLFLSGGAQAYGRFRVPISAILIIYSSMILSELDLTNLFKRKLISLKRFSKILQLFK